MWNAKLKMEIFNSELYRSFAIGFGITALVLVVAMAPALGIA